MRERGEGGREGERGGRERERGVGDRQREIVYVCSHMDFGANGIIRTVLWQIEGGSLSVITRPICNGSEWRLFHLNCRSHYHHMYL